MLRVYDLLMSKTITLRLQESNYKLFKQLAEQDNRSISNFIETAALRFVDNVGLMDEFENQEILNNDSLMKSIAFGHNDANLRKGEFVWLQDFRDGWI